MTKYQRQTVSLISGVAALAALLLVSANPASAQRAVARQGGFGGGQGGPGRFGRQQQAPTLATTPVSATTPYFGLTEEQAKRIEELQKAARPDMQAMFSNMQNMRQNGGQFSREQMTAIRTEMQTKMEKVRTDQEAANREIGRVLTSEQRPQIASFLRDVELFSKVGLPLELIKPLDLDGPQKSRLQRIGEDADKDRDEKARAAFQKMRDSGAFNNRNQNNQNDPNAANGGRPDFSAIGDAVRSSRDEMRAKAIAVLTETQKALVAQWDKDHPNAANQLNGFAGFGGFGGGRGNGNNGNNGNPTPN